METVLSVARELSSALAGCPAYIRYLAAKDHIGKNSDLYNRIKEYKHIHLEFELKYMHNADSPFNEEQYLSKLYAELMLNNDAREFLISERELLALIKEVNSIVLNSCKVDMDFLE